MRILVINYEYPPIGGGGGFVTSDILERMAYVGHQVTIITSSFKGLKKREIVNGVDVIRVPVLMRGEMEVASLPSMLSYLPSSLFSAIYHLRNEKFDIINTHFVIPSGPSGHLISKIYGLPNVLSIHGGDIYDPSKKMSPHKVPALSKVVGLLLNKADRVVAQSNDTRGNACKYYNTERPIDIIPLCIKKPVYRRVKRDIYDLRDDELVFITVGRMVARKNLRELIEIAGSIRDRFDFKLLIVGEGPERSNLESLIKKIGLGNNVRLMGNVTNEEKFQLLDLSDLYLSTTMHEGFGLVFLEAMECGLPVICYNNGGQRDFLESGKTGFLVELGNKNEFAGRVVDLVSDNGLRNKAGRANRSIVQDYYEDKCADKYISLFEDVIADSKDLRK